MIFDENYFKQKKEELNSKNNVRMANVIQNIANLMNNFFAEVRESDERRKELNEMEVEGKSKKEIEKEKPIPEKPILKKK